MMWEKTELLGLPVVNLPFDPDLDDWDGEPDNDEWPVDDGVLSSFWEGEHLAGNP